jgi:hypothetical protein
MEVHRRAEAEENMIQGARMQVLEQQAAAEDRLWLAETVVGARKDWLQKLHEAEATGNPYDPRQFDEDYQNDLMARVEKAPSERARMMAQADLIEFGGSLFRQNLQANASAKLAKQKLALQNTFGDLAAGAGDVYSYDGSIMMVSQLGDSLAAAIGPTALALKDRAIQQIEEKEMYSVLQAAGPLEVAKGLREGKLGQSLSPAKRDDEAMRFERRAEMLAVKADREIAEHERQLELAAKEGDKQAQAALDARILADPQPSHKDALSAVEKRPLDELVIGRMQGIYDEYKNQNVSQTALMKLTTNEAARVFADNAYGRSPHEMEQAVMAVAQRLPPDHPITRKLAQETMRMASEITPGQPQYDPVKAALRDETLQTEYAQGRQMLDEALRSKDHQQIDAAKTQWRETVGMIESYQEMVGIPQSEWKYLPARERDHFSRQMTEPQNAKQVAMFANEAYGDKAPAVMREILQDRKGNIPGVVELAMMNASDQEVWEAATAKNDGIKMSKDDEKVFNRALSGNKTYSDFMAATVGAEGRSEQQMKYIDGIKHLAMFHVGKYQNAMSPDYVQAVRWAVSKTFQDAYNVVTSNGKKIAIPAGITQSPVTQKQMENADGFLRHNLNRVRAVGMSPEEVDKHAYWQHEDGVMRLWVDRGGAQHRLLAYGQDGQPTYVEMNPDEGLSVQNSISPAYLSGGGVYRREWDDIPVKGFDGVMPGEAKPDLPDLPDSEDGGQIEMEIGGTVIEVPFDKSKLVAPKGDATPATEATTPQSPPSLTVAPPAKTTLIPRDMSKGTLAAQSNNPFNIKYYNQKNVPLGEKMVGVVPGKHGTNAAYADMESGIMAGIVNLRENYKKQDTVSKIISRYAPPSENNTNKYIATVAEKSGVAPNEKIEMFDKSGKVTKVGAVILHTIMQMEDHKVYAAHKDDLDNIIDRIGRTP